MKEFIKILEQSGFLVENIDDYGKIEIRDLKNGGELLTKDGDDFFRCVFHGKNDRQISLFCRDYWHTSLSINCGSGLIIALETFSEREKWEYNLTLRDGENTKATVELFGFSRNIGGMHINMEQTQDKMHIANFYLDHGLLDTGIEMYVKGRKEKELKVIDIEDCSTELYSNNIREFLNYVDNSKIKEGINIVLPFFSEYFDSIFSVYETRYERYMTWFENQKIAITDKFQKEISDIESQEERLRNFLKKQKQGKKQA